MIPAQINYKKDKKKTAAIFTWSTLARYLDCHSRNEVVWGLGDEEEEGQEGGGRGEDEEEEERKERKKTIAVWNIRMQTRWFSQPKAIIFAASIAWDVDVAAATAALRWKETERCHYSQPSSNKYTLLNCFQRKVAKTFWVCVGLSVCLFQPKDKREKREERRWAGQISRGQIEDHFIFYSDVVTWAI